MRTATAYISKLKAENLARAFKVQDTNHRLFTSTLYRGAAGCGPVDFTQIEYVEPCLCEYIGSAPKAPFILKKPRISNYDGGIPSYSGPVLDGGSVTSSGIILNGGNP